ncbi:sensor histidine kinase [Selenomonas ruminantium]|uniref:histidine kinase n=1 Tax=Selenomonas ruminantium TaxID=971 RepID=A0A927ZTT2_SELRU|nr:sensor histidine kinase [Selenomonas ruminantium]MBE6091790.1 sensor histidine kinase [Selenomonas ruminantium]
MMGSYTPEQRRLEWLYGLLGLYNGLVVLLMAGFMCLTQQKIVSTMSAHEFLSTLPIVPLPAMKGFWLSMGAYALLLFLGKLYRHGGLESGQRQLIFAAEIGICMLLMKSLNLAYDGIVLLAVADLMHRYHGENQSWLLLVAMLGLYFMANYNMAIFQRHVAPFDVYAAYYRPEVQSVLLAIKNAFQSLNIVLFVLYLVLLVQSQHHEKERIASLNKQLEEANVRLRAYALEAERTAETRERNRLAREIHDTLGHTLTGIAAGLDACIVLVDAAPAVVKKQLEKIRETARHGIVDVRRSVKKLRPDDLEKLPLQQAIKKVIAEFSASSGVEIQLVELGWPEKLREDEEEVIYRIVQEGITNARRHGKATKVTVTCGLEPGRFYIIIADNGEGCAETKQGFGLRHMEERLELLHGRLRYWSDKGFTLEATIPMGKNVMDNHGEDKE